MKHGGNTAQFTLPIHLSPSFVAQNAKIPVLCTLVEATETSPTRSDRNKRPWLIWDLFKPRASLPIGLYYCWKETAENKGTYALFYCFISLVVLTVGRSGTFQRSLYVFTFFLDRPFLLLRKKAPNSAFIQNTIFTDFPLAPKGLKKRAFNSTKIQAMTRISSSNEFLHPSMWNDNEHCTYPYSRLVCNLTSGREYCERYIPRDLKRVLSSVSLMNMGLE